MPSCSCWVALEISNWFCVPINFGSAIVDDDAVVDDDDADDDDDDGADDNVADTVDDAVVTRPT